MIGLTQVDRFKADLSSLYDSFAMALIGRYLAIQSAAGTPAPPFFAEQFKSAARTHVMQFAQSADNMIAGWASDLGDGVDIAGGMRELQSSLRAVALTKTKKQTKHKTDNNLGLKTLFTRP